jgi:hypothetical protein
VRNCNSSRPVTRAWLLVFFLFLTAANAQNFTNLAGEYRIIGALSGDQVNSSVAFNDVGGWVVWQDNVTDGSGMGISARRLNSTLSGDLSVFRVNQNGLGEQEFPQVTMLKNGGAAFVWQGGRTGFQDIFARFVAADGTFLSSEFLVNSYTNQFQVQPVVASLVNSNVVVAWNSQAQDGHGQGVYARLLSPTGEILGNEFRVNQATNRNQRAASITGLSDGNFVVVWISESDRAITPADNRPIDALVWGRIFNSAGTPVNGEFLVSETNSICGHPSVAAIGDGGFVVNWSRYDLGNTTNTWDVVSRSFSANGTPASAVVRLNTTTLGEQKVPRVSAAGSNYLSLWTSHDGSSEGVYGRYMMVDGTPITGEFRVNTTTGGKQMQPSLAGNSTGNFVVVWSSYVVGGPAFDLYAQRFSESASGQLFPPAAPYVSVLNSGAVNVTWPELAGYSVAYYELEVNGGGIPFVVNGNTITVTNLTASTTYTFRLRYRLTSDVNTPSPWSVATTATTWGPDNTVDGLPDDWQATYWGANPANWPSPNQDSDGDGASNLMEFLGGTDPSDAASVLRTRLHRTPQGSVFSWQTVPGFIYQVQSASELGSWQNLGLPRFAHGLLDSVNLGPVGAKGFYRVIRIR